MWSAFPALQLEILHSNQTKEKGLSAPVIRENDMNTLVHPWILCSLSMGLRQIRLYIVNFAKQEMPGDGGALIFILIT